MPFHIPYYSVPDGRGSTIDSVILNIGISNADPNKSRIRPLEAVLDSGSSRCVFDADFALGLGLRLESGIATRIEGIGGFEKLWLHPVTLHVPGGPVKTLAGFKHGLSVSGLLGMAGFFEHYVVTFDGALKECSLERIYSI